MSERPWLFDSWAQVALWCALGACVWLVLGLLVLAVYALVELTL